MLCAWKMGRILFLLTPLREGRPERRITVYNARTITTHAPAGGATQGQPQ